MERNKEESLQNFEENITKPSTYEYEYEKNTINNQVISIEKQKGYFKSGVTFPLSFRLSMLSKLSDALEKYENKLIKALYDDLHKSEFESITTEIGLIKKSIIYAIKHLPKFMKVKKVKTPLMLFGRKSYTINEPYGTVLIIGPFNYPALLVLDPLVGAIAGGNCAVIKPSESSPNVAKVIEELIRETFDEEYIKVYQGEADVNEKLLEEDFDLVFFTGSPRVGKIVMEKSAKHLTPVILELGGKSPAIVMKDADVENAARKIMWGKILNAGQICIAPDYCLVHEEVKDLLISEMKSAVNEMLGSNIVGSSDYCRIVNQRHADRLISIIEDNRNNILFGGKYSETFIEPTVIQVDDFKRKIMEEEIFGPILPVMTFIDEEEIFEAVEKNPCPLAFYIFSKDNNKAMDIIARIRSGHAMINDVITFIGNENLPFGGIGNSGIGRYHGHYTLESFTHKKAVARTYTTKFDSIFMPPYTRKKLTLIKMFFK